MPLRPEPWGFLLEGYGLHWPQGAYPSAISSSRLPEKVSRFSSLMEAAPEQSGSWNFMELVLRM